MQIKPIHLDDRLQLKKPHACGGDVFRVLRVGSDVRIVCEKCGHDLVMERVKLEKAIKKTIVPEPSDPANR